MNATQCRRGLVSGNYTATLCTGTSAYALTVSIRVMSVCVLLGNVFGEVLPSYLAQVAVHLSAAVVGHLT